LGFGAYLLFEYWDLGFYIIESFHNNFKEGN